MKAGDYVRFGLTGSIGVIEEANHYGGFYVQWRYGNDLYGDPVTARSSCREEDLTPVTQELFQAACARRFNSGVVL